MNNTNTNIDDNNYIDDNNELDKLNDLIEDLNTKFQVGVEQLRTGG